MFRPKIRSKKWLDLRLISAGFGRNKWFFNHLFWNIVSLDVDHFEKMSNFDNRGLVSAVVLARISLKLGRNYD